MSMTPNEADEEAYLEKLYDSFRENALEDSEVYDRIVKDFKEARLRDYYLEHSEVIERPQFMLDEARSLLVSSPSASLVFAVASGEIGLNFGILAPILHGCFHTESDANFLVETIIKQKNEKLTKALLKILNNYTEIDFQKIILSGTTSQLWKEITVIHKLRNRILHHGHSVNTKDATRAIAVSETILNSILKAVVDKLGLDE